MFKMRGTILNTARYSNKAASFPYPKIEAMLYVCDNIFSIR